MTRSAVRAAKAVAESVGAQAPLIGGFSSLHVYLPDQELAVAIVAGAGADSEVG